MKYFLVKESGNYADEFDIEGFKLFESDSEEDLKKIILNKIKEDYLDEDDEELIFPMEFGFGTNEAVEINSESELWDGLNITEISETEYTILLKLFPSVDKYPFGLTGIL